MKRITKSELPNILTEEIINILVEMALESPKTTFDWAEISQILEDRGQLFEILGIVEKRKKEVEKIKEDSKSDEQKQKEKEDWEEFVKNINPKDFYGNIGQPETIQEYKDKYGVWPPGYDENGNKT